MKSNLKFRTRTMSFVNILFPYGRRGGNKGTLDRAHFTHKHKKNQDKSEHAVDENKSRCSSKFLQIDKKNIYNFAKLKKNE